MLSKRIIDYLLNRLLIQDLELEIFLHSLVL